MKTALSIFGLLIFAIFLLAVGFGFGRVSVLNQEYYEAQKIQNWPGTALPSQTDIQELLNQIEPVPRLDVDGVIGTKSRDKWDRLICQREAAKCEVFFGDSQ